MIAKKTADPFAGLRISFVNRSGRLKKSLSLRDLYSRLIGKKPPTLFNNLFNPAQFNKTPKPSRPESSGSFVVVNSKMK
jgi:hypothetical protein